MLSSKVSQTLLYKALTDGSIYIHIFSEKDLQKPMPNWIKDPGNAPTFKGDGSAPGNLGFITSLHWKHDAMIHSSYKSLIRVKYFLYIANILFTYNSTVLEWPLKCTCPQQPWGTLKYPLRTCRGQLQRKIPCPNDAGWQQPTYELN